MHSIFAIEPHAVNNWQDLRYIVEKFGISKGLLIAQYPKSWGRMVIEACKKNNVQGKEFLRIVERLNQIKNDRMISLQLPYASSDWCENTIKPEIIQHLDAIIVKGEEVTPKHYKLDTVDESIFENHRELKVKKKAANLARAATYILLDAEYITIIDPYFTPDNKCTKVLAEMLLIAEQRKNNLRTVSIFVASSKDRREQHEVKTAYKKSLEPWLNKGIDFEITRLKDDALDFDFHARYLITNKGGLRYDRGFVEPHDLATREQETDIICMENEIKTSLTEQYAEKLDPKFIVDRLIITS